MDIAHDNHPSPSFSGTVPLSSFTLQFYTFSFLLLILSRTALPYPRDPGVYPTLFCRLIADRRHDVEVCGLFYNFKVRVRVRHLFRV